MLLACHSLSQEKYSSDSSSESFSIAGKLLIKLLVRLSTISFSYSHSSKDLFYQRDMTSKPIRNLDDLIGSPVVVFDNNCLSIPIPLLADDLDDEGVSCGLQVNIGKGTRGRKGEFVLLLVSKRVRLNEM